MHDVKQYPCVQVQSNTNGLEFCIQTIFQLKGIFMCVEYLSLSVFVNNMSGSFRIKIKNSAKGKHISHCTISKICTF